MNQENKKISIYGNAFEAIIGGIYLDKDFSQAASVVINLLEKEIESLKKNKIKDKKTLLQEELQQRKVDLPVYKLNYENDESFNVICEVQELDLLSEGQGKNKKEAEQNAAANLLKKLINDNG